MRMHVFWVIIMIYRAKQSPISFQTRFVMLILCFQGISQTVIDARIIFGRSQDNRFMRCFLLYLLVCSVDDNEIYR